MLGKKKMEFSKDKSKPHVHFRWQLGVVGRPLQWEWGGIADPQDWIWALIAQPRVD